MRPAERGRLGAATAVEMSGPPGLRRAGRRGPGGGSLGSAATGGEGTDAAEGVTDGAAGNVTSDTTTTER